MYTFSTRCLAEAIRLREQAGESLEQGRAVAIAKQHSGDAEQKILARADYLAEQLGIKAELHSWQLAQRSLWLIALVLALVSGFVAAWAVLGDGSQAINVIWALGSLLGVHLLMLLVWLLSVIPSADGSSSLPGSIWLGLSKRLPAKLVNITRAWVSLLSHANLLRFWFGSISHGLWSMAMLGALLGLMAALSLRRYGFVWESTILPTEVFVAAFSLLGWLPAQLGIAIPDPATIRASDGIPMGDETARVTWAYFLLSAVFLYGLLPRFLLWLLCWGWLRVASTRLRLDLTQPGFANLVQQLSPASQRLGITAPAPGRLHQAHLQHPSLHQAKGAALIALEWADTPPWPERLDPGITLLGTVDSREQRWQALEQLGAHPVERLLIVCDPRLSPDRGSLEFIVKLAEHARASMIWLPHSDIARAPQRRQYWLESLQQLGFPVEAIEQDDAIALAWLGGRDE